MSQCKGRYADKECHFQNGRIYYTEKRCTIKAAGKRCSDPELCIRCYKKSCEPFDSKKQSKGFQGKVGGEYFKRSYIFGSPWFLEKNEQKEYTISDEDFHQAKEAQRIAILGTQMPRKKKEEESKGQEETKMDVIPSSSTITSPTKNLKKSGTSFLIILTIFIIILTIFIIISTNFITLLQ